MKKKLAPLATIILFVSLLGCGGNGKESAASIAQKWCDLNGKVAKSDGDAKDAAKAARKKFEDNMDVKYKNDQAFMDEIKKEAEKCEAASEGR